MENPVCPGERDHIPKYMRILANLQRHCYALGCKPFPGNTAKCMLRLGSPIVTYGKHNHPGGDFGILEG